MSSASVDLAGKTIVITGASSGFGRGAAIALAAKAQTSFWRHAVSNCWTN